MWDGINRRKFPRASYKCVIGLKGKGELLKAITTNTENIGMGGICVVLEKGLELFKNVELEIILKDGEQSIRCEGSIVWVVKKYDPTNKAAVTYDTGIEFTNIKEVSRARIGKIVDKLLTSP